MGSNLYYWQLWQRIYTLLITYSLFIIFYYSYKNKNPPLSCHFHTHFRECKLQWESIIVGAYCIRPRCVEARRAVSSFLHQGSAVVLTNAIWPNIYFILNLCLYFSFPQFLPYIFFLITYYTLHITVSSLMTNLSCIYSFIIWIFFTND